VSSAEAQLDASIPELPRCLLAARPTGTSEAAAALKEVDDWRVEARSSKELDTRLVRQPDSSTEVVIRGLEAIRTDWTLLAGCPARATAAGHRRRILGELGPRG
jgi:hypothetical protein